MHKALPPADEMPWTISYVIRKRTQIDSYNELPSEKRPPDKILWHGTPEDIDRWFDKVFKSDKGKDPDEFVFYISDDDIG